MIATVALVFAGMYRTPLSCAVMLALLVGCELDTVHYRKHSESMRSLEIIADAFEKRRQSEGAYPALREQDCTELVWLQGVVDGSHMTDGWDRAFRCMSSEDDFVVWSQGRDGIVDAPLVEGPDPSFDTDIVIHKGGFWRGLIGSRVPHSPRGTQPPLKIFERL